MSDKQIPWHKNDELFKKELYAGLDYQERVARRIRKMGYKCVVPVLEFRKSIKDMHKFKDIADIEVTGRGLPRPLIVEVKSRRLYFTCPRNYPWPTVFIDTVEGYGSKIRKPDVYCCVSRKTGAAIALVARSDGAVTWDVKTSWDRIRHIKVTTYTNPKEEWVTLNQAMERAHRNIYG